MPSVATWGLVFIAPQLVKLALLFGPAEYFALYTLAFATLGGIASRNQAKAAIAAALGLGIGMIGVDHQTGVPRLTFGNIHLYDGSTSWSRSSACSPFPRFSCSSNTRAKASAASRRRSAGSPPRSR